MNVKGKYRLTLKYCRQFCKTFSFSALSKMIQPEFHSPIQNFRFGPRFFGLSDCYDPVFRKDARRISKDCQLNEVVKEGVYACVAGPSFETPAELRMLGNYLSGNLVDLSSPDLVGCPGKIRKNILQYWSPKSIFCT